MIEPLKKLYTKIFGDTPEIYALKGGGSPRHYYRLISSNGKAIGVWSKDVKENRDFVRLQKVLESNGIKVPEIYSVSDDYECYLLQDLGDLSLFDALQGENRLDLAKQALKNLVKIHGLPSELWQDKVGFPPFSERLVKWDLNYFKYDFLKPEHIDFDEEKLEDDFEKLSKLLVSQEFKRGFMYRDFQSRNIMIYEENLWFIDFQSARKGPVLYDAVSFIWQAKAPFTAMERESLEDYYIGLVTTNDDEKRKIHLQFKIMQLFRNLQVLGAYGFRGLIERKGHFIESIPKAVNNLSYLVEKGVTDSFPEIKRVALELKERMERVQKKEGQEGELTVTVSSFSYKKGYPEQIEGNGGGFMFDCRAIHNPGRYAEYKDKTGLDKEVIDFLDSTNEASDFVKNAIRIVSPSVERYKKRGFTSLQIGFGCTGGQHRSVYCAEKFARQLKALFPDVNVKISHREQNI